MAINFDLDNLKKLNSIMKTSPSEKNRDKLSYRQHRRKNTVNNISKCIRAVIEESVQAQPTKESQGETKYLLDTLI